MKRWSGASGARRKRMSSLIFIRFCLTKTSGSPSSFDPACGTLIRYSLAIGRKTCWIRKRSAVSMRSRTCASVVGVLIAADARTSARSVHRLRDRAAVGVPAGVAVAEAADQARARPVGRPGCQELGQQRVERLALALVERAQRLRQELGARREDPHRGVAAGSGQARADGPRVVAA